MACAHERIKSVNCVIYCDICGEKLPVDYLVGKSRIQEQNAAEGAKNAKETTSEKAPTATKKRTTKKGGK